MISRPQAITSPRNAAARAPRSLPLPRLVVALVCCAALSCFVAPLRAQSGRMRPEPQPSPSPGAQQRPRRATPTDDAPPGQPASPRAPSRTGSLPQTQGGAQPKQNTGGKPQPDPSEVVDDDDEVYKVESNLVPVSASVTDALGHSITDLKIEDFELRVDGQPKPISDISHAETPVRIALLFDNSSSIRPTRELEKQAAINFFRRVIRPIDQAAIFSISTVPTLDQPLTSDVSRLVRTIEHYGEVEGSTSLFDTIAMAAEYLRPQPGRKVMIVVSDGVETTSNLEDYGEMVRRVLASDCQVFVIQTGLSDNANLRDLTAERRMQDLTSYTGGFVNVPKLPSDLEAAFSQIAADLAQQYVLSYYPSDDGRDGRFRIISLRVKTRGDVRVRARRGYYPRRRDNSAVATGPQNSELAASAPDFIRDPIVLNPAPAQTRQAPSSARAPAANTNADARASAPAVAASAQRRSSSKNLDPDAGDEATDAAAKPKPSVRLGTFVPPPASEQPARGASDSPPPLKQAEGPPAESRTQPTPQTSQPEAARTNPHPPTPAASSPTQTQPEQNSTTQNPTPQSSTPPNATPQSSTPQGSSLQSSPQKSPAPSNSPQASPSPSSSSPSRPSSSGESEAAKQPPIIAGGVLNARARTLPVPVYPEAAKRMRAAGVVVVEVKVDESGRVIEARAASGPLALRETAVSAARRATFPPATVAGQPAQVKGVINYTFTF